MCTSLHMVRPASTTLFSIFLAILHLSVSLSDQLGIILRNECNVTVWPALFTTSGNRNFQPIYYRLNTSDHYTITTSDAWSGYLWGRTFCTGTDGNFTCLTGDCGTRKLSCRGNRGVPPATLAEFRLGNDGIYSYNINVVEGFNIPLAVTPLGDSREDLNCSSAGCPTNLNTVCPTELRVMKRGEIVACKGVCSMNNVSITKTCKPNPYSLTIKKACPQAYMDPYDNETKTISCSAKFFKIIFCPASSAGSLNQSVSVGDSLIAGNGPTRWLSPLEDFSFGFYQLPNELFLLAIWYDKIQNDSIIWYANGDNPAPKGSRLVLSNSYGLVLTSPKGSELWRSSNFTSGRISRGLMKDDGNFQLLDENFVVLWASYNNFTDTLVPGQELNLNDYLYSRQGEFNFSRGRFELRLQESGDVVLNLVSFPSNTNTNAQLETYYDSHTFDPYNKSANLGLKFIFEKYVFLYILKKNHSKFSIIGNQNKTLLNDDLYYKATINYDGVFTLSYFPKYQKNGKSWLVAKTIPENMCLNYDFNNGQGVCGINSICNPRYDQRPMCRCLEGYSLIFSDNIYGGCKQNFQVICPSRHNDSHKDTYLMMKLSNIYWPKSDYKTCNSCTLEECMDYCLQDCLCVLAFFNGSSCWKNNLPLLHGRKELTVKGSYFIKINKTDTPSSFSNETTGQVNSKTKKKKIHQTLIIVISVIFMISALVGAIFFCHKHKKIESGVSNKSIIDKNLRVFTFEEITKITNNFREELGRGSCSIVYKGIIDAYICVAVKKLDKLFQDSDKEFQTEMNVIIETHHRNLVRLHGYCSEEQHRILVYELMSNGTLASFIFTPLKPSWNQRVWIIIGIARGLVYLHEECCTQIIHCDIKPQNILLDDDYNAKISDFGLAKLLLINQSHTKTGIRGTKGYVAPDWFRSAPITAKVDAYSFGVLLLEIICCRKNVEDDNVGEEKRILTDWAYDCYKAGKMDILLESELEVDNEMTKLEKFVMISIWCTQEDPSQRPSMKNVLLMLEGIVNVEIPPNPYLYSSSG